MKRFILILFLFLIPGIVNAQLGNRYFHADTLNATTAERDCTWTDVWQVVVIYADTVDLWVKIGAPDVGNWASRNWILLEEGNNLSIGPSPNLKKLAWKTDSGTGVVYVLGYKKAVQSYSMIWRNDYEKAMYNRYLVPVFNPITE
ncbi:hypothetical protein LCGC14_1126920 [marine sediment metagenome]|uniref:Uncharacterized protein n=1 Tax=marine sediment metagenome TaxID=412755 RepID=A0A0F9M725_9ZZZZ